MTVMPAETDVLLMLSTVSNDQELCLRTCTHQSGPNY